MSIIDASCLATRRALFEAGPEGAKLAPERARHLQACPACRSFAATLATTLAEARTVASEPSPEAVLADIERRLQPTIADVAAHSGRRFAAWVWPRLALSAAAAVLVVVLVTRFGPLATAPQQLRVMAAKATTFQIPGASAAAVSAHQMLAEGTTLTTAAEGASTVTIGPATLRLLERGELAVRQLTPQAARWQLSRGDLVVRLLHDGSTLKSLQVELPRARVWVTGTVLALHSDAGEDRVAVIEGKVRVEPKEGPPVEVAAGDSLILGVAQTRQALSAAVHTRVLERLVDGASDSWMAPGVTSMPQTPEPAALDAPPLARKGAARVRRHLSGVSDDLAAAIAAGECAQAEELWRTMQARERERAEALAEVADCYRAHDDTGSALRLYDHLATKFAATAAGENAGFEVAQLHLSLGQKRAAAAAFAAFVARYPTSVLAEEALVRNCGLSVEARNYPAAEACLARFSAFPGSRAHRREVWLLQATVLREAHRDCVAALKLYDAYIADPGDLVEAARQGRAACERELRQR